VGATVTRVGPPLDPSVSLHPVDLSNEAHRLDFEQIGESRLVDPFIPGEIAQHLALRPREAKNKEGALVKPPSEQAGDVVDEKPEAAMDVHSETQSEATTS
jgi:hypothetical protein